MISRWSNPSRAPTGWRSSRSAGHGSSKPSAMPSSRFEAMTDHRVLLIITPVRNEAEYLELTARAVEGQRRPPDLWIVVDDGSTDATPALLRELEARIPFLRVVSTPDNFTVDRGDRHTAAAATR